MGRCCCQCNEKNKIKPSDKIQDNLDSARTMLDEESMALEKIKEVQRNLLEVKSGKSNAKAASGKQLDELKRFIKPDQPFLEHYKMGPLIQHGSLASVFQCESKLTGQKKAVKVLDQALLKNKKDKSMFHREVTLIQMMDHASLI